VAKLSMIAKAKRQAEVRGAARTPGAPVGAPRAYMRKFEMCRICFGSWPCGARSGRDQGELVGAGR